MVKSHYFQMKMILKKRGNLFLDRFGVHCALKCDLRFQIKQKLENGEDNGTDEMAKNTR